MKKIVLLLLFTLLLATSIFAQKRTTSVKGYYRKDGTYVRPHTRSYTPGASSSSSYSSSSSSSADSKDNEVETTTLKFSKNSTNAVGNKGTYGKYNGQKIALTTLKFNTNNSETDTTSLKNKTNETGVVFYVSVLRYKGKTLDVCPVPRGYSGWSFDKVDHEFDKKLISTEDALDLVSNYGWRIYNDQISKDFELNYNDKRFPPYLTKTIEAIVVE